MYARVARWEGGSPDSIRQAAQQIEEQSKSGPPEGVPAKGITLLIDEDKGQALAISLFESEDDLRQGDQALNEMNPQTDEAGRRTSVESYEVAIDVRA